MSEIILKEESYRIIGACFEVYNQKGFGFTEPIYQECLAIELELKSIPFVAQPKLEIDYKGRILTNFFKPDFICFDEIVIEIKAASTIAKEHVSQTLNYLAATRFKLAWLINVGNPNGLERKRIVNERPKSGRKLLD
ncbi:MAG: GxxExxY protein [Acidobacteria bacterium]|nr:GxxExxY protein [Acidobacteriota bacterium]